MNPPSPPLSSPSLTYYHLLPRIQSQRPSFSIFLVSTISERTSATLSQCNYVFFCTESYRRHCILRLLLPVSPHSTIFASKFGLFYRNSQKPPNTPMHRLHSPFKLLYAPHNTRNPPPRSPHLTLSSSQSAGFTRTSRTQEARSLLLLNDAWWTTFHVISSKRRIIAVHKLLFEDAKRGKLSGHWAPRRRCGCLQRGCIVLLRFIGRFLGKYMCGVSTLRHRVCYTVAEYGLHYVVGSFILLGIVMHGIRLLKTRYSHGGFYCIVYMIVVIQGGAFRITCILFDYPPKAKMSCVFKHNVALVC